MYVYCTSVMVLSQVLGWGWNKMDVAPVTRQTTYVLKPISSLQKVSSERSEGPNSLHQAKSKTAWSKIQFWITVAAFHPRLFPCSLSRPEATFSPYMALRYLPVKSCSPATGRAGNQRVEFCETLGVKAFLLSFFICFIINTFAVVPICFHTLIAITQP